MAGMDSFDDDFRNNFASVPDVPGFNYKPHRYPEACAKLPQGFLFGSETASTVSSRGVYKFPVVKGKDKKYADNQSSYDLEACNWSRTPRGAGRFALRDGRICVDRLRLPR